MLLSVCLVVRDKSRTISRTINSVKKIADEIILIDLDSLDNTRVIARKVGAKVYHLNRKTDFYQSRNIAREKARGEWVLFLEGDEELIDDHQQLRVILQDTNIDGFYLPIVNFKRFKYIAKEVEDEFPFPYLSFRLYKNNRRYFYSKDTYESITNSILKINGEASLKVLHLPIVMKINCSLIPGETQLYSWNLDDVELLADNNTSPFFKEAIKRIGQGDYELAIRRLEEAYSLTQGY